MLKVNSQGGEELGGISPIPKRHFEILSSSFEGS
jgi:hypothetical protein